MTFLYLKQIRILHKHLADKIYLNDVVFTTGIAAHNDDFILASGELDLACRITRISKKYFSNAFHK